MGSESNQPHGQVEPEGKVRLTELWITASKQEDVDPNQGCHTKNEDWQYPDGL
jgi:hypothetical protein